MSQNKIKPLVVIRCLTYNHEPYIKDALDGFVMQKTNFPFIVIIHDDASNDLTQEIIQEYSKKYPDIIKPIIEKENQYSKNDGSLRKIIDTACASTGAKYVAMCEGDDYWTDPLKLQKQVDFLENNKEYGICYTKAISFEQKAKRYSQPWGGNYETFETLVTCNTIPTLTVVLRIDLLLNYNNLISKKKNNWKMGDYPLWLYFSLVSKIKFLDYTTGVYRVLTNSASHFNNDLDKWLSFRKSTLDIQLYYLDKSTNPTDKLKNIVCFSYIKDLLQKRSKYVSLKNTIKEYLHHSDLLLTKRQKLITLLINNSDILSKLFTRYIQLHK